MSGAHAGWALLLDTMPDVGSAIDGIMGVLMEVQLLQHVLVPSSTAEAVLRLVAQSAGTSIKWFPATQRELEARKLVFNGWGCIAAKLLFLVSRGLASSGDWLEQRLQHGRRRLLLRQLHSVVRLLLLSALRLARSLVAANRAGVASALGSNLVNVACNLAWLHHTLQQVGPRATVAAYKMTRAWEPLLGALTAQLCMLPLDASALLQLLRFYGPWSEPLCLRGAQLVFRSPVHIEKSLTASLQPITDEVVRGGSSSPLLGVLLARATDLLDVMQTSHHQPGRDLLVQLSRLMVALSVPTLLLTEYSPRALRTSVRAVDHAKANAAGDLDRYKFLCWAASADRERWTSPVSAMSLHQRTRDLVQGASGSSRSGSSRSGSSRSGSSSSSSGSRSATDKQHRNHALALEEYIFRLTASRGAAGRLAGQCLGCWNSRCMRTPYSGTSLCARCGIARYCSAGCQAEAWPCHRVVCARMQARRRRTPV
jgi:hypothetical protein